MSDKGARKVRSSEAATATLTGEGATHMGGEWPWLL